MPCCRREMYLERCAETSIHCHGGPWRSAPAQGGPVRNPARRTAQVKENEWSCSSHPLETNAEHIIYYIYQWREHFLCGSTGNGAATVRAGVACRQCLAEVIGRMFASRAQFSRQMKIVLLHITNHGNFSIKCTYIQCWNRVQRWSSLPDLGLAVSSGHILRLSLHPPVDRENKRSCSRVCT